LIVELSDGIHGSRCPATSGHPRRLLRLSRHQHKSIANAPSQSAQYRGDLGVLTIAPRSTGFAAVGQVRRRLRQGGDPAARVHRRTRRCRQQSRQDPRRCAPAPDPQRDRGTRTIRRQFGEQGRVFQPRHGGRTPELASHSTYGAANSVQLVGIEGTAAAAYWSLWLAVPLHFARRDQVPDHWQRFEPRNSAEGKRLAPPIRRMASSTSPPLGRKNTRKAVFPANAEVNRRAMTGTQSISTTHCRLTQSLHGFLGGCVTKRQTHPFSPPTAPSQGCPRDRLDPAAPRDQACQVPTLPHPKRPADAGTRAGDFQPQVGPWRPRNPARWLPGECPAALCPV
jgi:hypothetical protein